MKATWADQPSPLLCVRGQEVRKPFLGWSRLLGLEPGVCVGGWGAVMFIMQVLVGRINGVRWDQIHAFKF